MFSKRSLKKYSATESSSKTRNTDGNGIGYNAGRQEVARCRTDSEDTRERTNIGFKSKDRRHQKVQKSGLLGSTTIVNVFLPLATKLGQGYIFTGICDSVHGGGGGWYPSMHCRWYLSIPSSRSPGGGIPACLAGGISAYLAAGLQGGVVSQHALQVSRPTPRGEV